MKHKWIVLVLFLAVVVRAVDKDADAAGASDPAGAPAPQAKEEKATFKFSPERCSTAPRARQYRHGRVYRHRAAVDPLGAEDQHISRPGL